MISAVPVLVLHDGRRVDIDSDLVLGRAPVAPEMAPEARPVSLSVPTVSKTHALVGSDSTGVWVVDLGSSNGTELVSPTGSAHRIESGVRVTVPDGHFIRVGTDTLLTLDRGQVDLDRTVVRRPAGPAIVPMQPGTDGRPLGDRSDDVDWSAEPPPPPGRPTPPDSEASSSGPSEPVAPNSPEPPSPPPPQASPPPPSSPEVPPAPLVDAAPSLAPSPETISIPSSPPPPSQQPSSPHYATPPPPSYDSPSYLSESSQPVSGGVGSTRSAVNVIGLLVLAVWGVVTTLHIARFLPDDIVFGDGWFIRFFAALTPDELGVFELFGVATVPGPLQWTTYLGTAGTALLAAVSLLTRNRVVRAVSALPVLLSLFFLFGFLVSLVRSEFNQFSDYAEFVLPGFLLPLVGLLLSQLPSGQSPTPQSSPFEPQQSPPQPPFGSAS